MGEFLKCECPHCGQQIEYPSEGTGQAVPCPTCEKAVTLTPVNLPAPVTQKPKDQKGGRTTLSKLTEETIRAKTQTGNTPLHRAAKSGKIAEIPRHLLTIELFMVRNNSFSRETPLHLAAQYGHLDKVPREFMTKETLTASTETQVKHQPPTRSNEPSKGKANKETRSNSNERKV